MVSQWSKNISKLMSLIPTCSYVFKNILFNRNSVLRLNKIYISCMILSESILPKVHWIHCLFVLWYTHAMRSEVDFPWKKQKKDKTVEECSFGWVQDSWRGHDVGEDCGSVYNMMISPNKVNPILVGCYSLGCSPYSSLYGWYNVQTRCLPL